MLYNSLAEIPIRNYLLANENKESLIKDNSEHSNSELNECWNKLIAEKIDAFGFEQSKLNLIEDEIEKAKLLCDWIVSEKTHPEFKYFDLEAKIEDIKSKQSSGMVVEGKILADIYKATKTLLNPISNTAYDLLLIINSINSSK